MFMPLRLRAVLAAKRRQHVELRRPLTWTGFQRVCEREHIRVTTGPLPADAVLLAGMGSAVIVLNSELDPRRHTHRGAHELAHWWLHAEAEPALYTMGALLVRDVREDEAEYVAVRLMEGW